MGIGAAPGKAQAFLGESVVLNPAKTDLTGPAKSIITNPTFLPDTVTEAETALGTGEASGAAAVFEGAGLLPALGAVVAYGAGTVIGSEICSVVGISGCWYFGSNGADPAKPSTGSWSFDTAPVGPSKGITTRPFEWHLYNGGLYVAVWKYLTPPSGYDGYYTGEAAEAGAYWQLPFRYSMTNRNLAYHATDNPSIGNYSHSAPGNWSEKLAKEIAGHESDAASRVGQKVASKIAGSEVHNPYGTYVSIPDCDGLVYATCAKELEEAGLVPHREDLDWSEVTTTTPDEVTELQPAKSTEVEKGTGVQVITNPDEEGMPIVVPQPETGETYSHYAARLNPALTPTRHDLDAAFVDPSAGPNAVIEVSPAPQTKLDPAVAHEVQVSTNPADAPLAGSPWSPPGLTGIDMSPLSGIPSPCGVFPFGLFCWMGEAFGQFNTTGKCPSAEVPVGDEANFDLSLCGDSSDQIMAYVRPALLLVFIVGCGIMFARGTKAVGPD